MDRKRKKSYKDGQEEDRRNPNNLSNRCVTCRRQVLDGDQVLCPFQRCNICQGGTCEDCVYKGTGELRWMCGCCYRKVKERASSSEQENWYFDLNETFDSLKAPTRSRKTCSTENPESRLNDSGANKCPSERMESQRAYAKNHANQDSESSHASSSSNSVRESLKNPIKSSESQYHSNIVHLSDSPSQRHDVIKPINCDKSEAHSDYKKMQYQKDCPVCDESQQHPEEAEYYKNRTDHLHQSKKANDINSGTKNNSETDESAKDTDNFIEYFRSHFQSSSYRKDNDQSKKSIHAFHNLKETQKSKTDLYSNNKPSILKNKQKTPHLHDNDNLRVDISTPYYSEPMTPPHKRVEHVEQQLKTKDTNISADHLRPKKEYYQDTSSAKPYLEKNDVRGRSFDRSRPMKVSLERNLSVDYHPDRRESHRHHLSRIDTMHHPPKELIFDDWEDYMANDRKSRSASYGRHHMSLTLDRDRGYSVDEVLYSQESYSMRRSRLAKQNTSVSDYYWEPCDQHKGHQPSLEPNLEHETEFEKALCSMRDSDYEDLEHESDPELNVCLPNPRRYICDEDRHYSDRISDSYVMPCCAIRAQQSDPVAVDYGGRRNSGQLKDRRTPRSHLNEAFYRCYPEGQAESNSWRDRNARSLDIPNHIPEIRRASLNENMKIRETLNNHDQKGKDEKIFKTDQNIRLPKTKFGDYPSYSYEDKYEEYR